VNVALILYALSVLAVFILSGFVAAHSRRHRETAGGGAFMWLSFLICVLALFEGLSIVAPNREWALFWFNLRFFCLAALPAAWFIFVLRFTGYASRLTSGHLAFLFLLPVITQAIIWTNSFHGLWVQKPAGFHQAGLFFIAQTSERIPGTWMWIHFIYSYALAVAGLTILAVTFARLARQDRGRLFTVGLGALVMTLFSALPSFNLVRDFSFNLLVPGIGGGLLIISLEMFRHRFFRSVPVSDKEKKAPVALITLLVLLVSGILAAGYVYYKHYEKNYRLEVERALSSIAELKVDEIVQWRKERLADASVLHENSALAQLVRRATGYPVEAGAKARLGIWLQQLKSAYRYRNVVLLDATGRVRYSAVPGAAQVCPDIRRIIPEIRQSGKIVFLDFHREMSGQAITLAVVIPVAEKGRFLGGIALIIDPEEYLYPMLRRWPTPSKTAETLLVRREGDDVVFLNELKYQKGTALNLRFPLSRDDLPASRAARGEIRVMEGLDYRGAPVVAALRSIPDSPWFMVARMDKAEIYAPVRDYFLLMIFMVGLLLFGTGAGIRLLWQRQSNRYYRRELASASALQASEEKFRKAFMTSPDAILITRWRDGCVVSVNDGFLQITGYTREEAEGNLIPKLDVWANPDDRKKLFKTIKADGSVSNAEVRFRKKSGEVIYGLVSGSMIDLNGEKHLLSFTRDITDRKNSEEALRKAHERLRRFHDSNIVGIVIATAEGSIVEANDYYLNLIGFSPEEFRAGKIDWRALTPPEWLAADEKAITEVRDGGACTPYEKQYLRRDGTRVDVFLAVARLPGDEEQLAAFAVDITDRKRVEKEVLRLNEELEERVAQRTAELSAKNKELERLNKVFVHRELRMREMKARISELEKAQK
jgi:PAS domain S-box-containing protein